MHTAGDGLDGKRDRSRNHAVETQCLLGLFAQGLRHEAHWLPKPLQVSCPELTRALRRQSDPLWICASLAPCQPPKSRRQLVKVIYFQALSVQPHWLKTMDLGL